MSTTDFPASNIVPAAADQGMQLPACEETQQVRSRRCQHDGLTTAALAQNGVSQRVFDSIHNGVSILDRDFNVVRVNRWMERHYQAQLSLVGGKCYSVYHNRSSVCEGCPSLKALQSGERHSTIVPYPSSEESNGWMEVIASPIFDDEGGLVGVLELVREVTDWRRAELTLQQSRRQ